MNPPLKVGEVESFGLAVICKCYGATSIVMACGEESAAATLEDEVSFGARSYTLRAHLLRLHRFDKGDGAAGTQLIRD
jgi:hypothetical protein